MSKKLFQFDIDSQWDYENGFYLTGHPTRLAKALAQYELYKMIVDLPGHVVECGIYKGASFIRFSTFREILESPFSRKIIGFDVFGKFPEQPEGHDSEFVRRFEGAGGDGIPLQDLNEVLAYKGFKNIELVPGDVMETIPQYLQAHPELKIALLHIDVDVYKPSLFILKSLWKHVVKNGIVVFDDYGTVSGETLAIDEFFCKEDVCIKKLSITHIPAYIRK